MAYDLIFGNTKANWSRGTTLLAGNSSIGLDLTPEERSRIEKLALIEMKATKGDAEAGRQIIKINEALTTLQKKAARGDAKATRIIATLKESGLVQQIATTSKTAASKLVMAGDDDPNFDDSRQFIRGLGEEERELATQAGSSEHAAILRRYDMGAIVNLSPLYKKGKFRRRKGKGLWGKIARAATVPMSALSQRGALMNGASPIIDGLPHPDPLTAEQKEDLRTYLRHLPPLQKTQIADQSRMVAHLKNMFGAIKDRAKQGEPAALKKWNELIRWTNKLQTEALTNNTSALIQLQNISRTEIFNPRFRIASS